MPTDAPHVLIRLGVEHADPYADVASLEEAMESNADMARLPNDVDLSTLALDRFATLLVEFPTFADGRGFSVARELRRKYDWQGELVADGPLIPDQYGFAAQCGFDAVRLDPETWARQSIEHWAEAAKDFDYTYQRGYATEHGPAVSVFDARKTAEVAPGNSPFDLETDAHGILREALDRYGRGLVLVSSMGVDSAVLLHMVSRVDADLPVVFLETGKHFPETLAYRDTLIEAFGLTDVRSVAPDPQEVAAEDPDGELNAHDPDACCALRKTRPLQRAIGGFAAQITGRKRYQTPERADMEVFEAREGQHKVNPLAAWTAKDVTAYIRRHDLPPHPLLSEGYRSVGCAPCTTPTEEGEDPRAGRWRNADKTECGIHMVDGKWQPVTTEKRYEVF